MTDARFCPGLLDGLSFWPAPWLTEFVDVVSPKVVGSTLALDEMAGVMKVNARRRERFHESGSIRTRHHVIMRM